MTSANGSYVRPDGEVVRSGTTLRQAEHLPSDNEGYVAAARGGSAMSPCGHPSSKAGSKTQGVRLRIVYCTRPGGHDGHHAYRRQ